MIKGLSVSSYEEAEKNDADIAKKEVCELYSKLEEKKFRII